MKNIFLVVLLLSVFGCSSAQNEASYAPDNYYEEDAVEMSKDANQTLAYTGKKSAQIAQNTPSNPETPKPVQVKMPAKMIKTGDMTIEVKSHEATRDKLNVLVKKHQGYVASENQQGYDYQMTTNLTIRVIPENFEQLMKDIGELAIQVERSSQDVKDVTEQFVDIQSRLKTKKAVEERYRAILQKATTIEDILKVENSLRVIVEEIEALEGKLRYLSDQVGYSTLSLTYYETLSRPFEQKKDGFFTRTGEALGDGWSGMLEIIIFALTVWPFWMILGVLIFLWRRRQKQKT